MALLTVAACNNDDSITGIATSQNAARTHSVFGLTGTPAGVPAAYYFVTESLVRPQVLTTGGVNFELAFDVADDGTVSLLPARTVVPEAPLRRTVLREGEHRQRHRGGTSDRLHVHGQPQLRIPWTGSRPSDELTHA